MIPREWMARAVAFVGAVVFLIGTFSAQLERPSTTAQIVSVAIFLFAVLVGTGDITIGKDWGDKP